jgi:hypothetical protein
MLAPSRASVVHRRKVCPLLSETVPQDWEESEDVLEVRIVRHNVGGVASHGQVFPNSHPGKDSATLWDMSHTGRCDAMCGPPFNVL